MYALRHPRSSSFHESPTKNTASNKGIVTVIHDNTAKVVVTAYGAKDMQRTQKKGGIMVL